MFTLRYNFQQMSAFHESSTSNVYFLKYNHPQLISACTLTQYNAVLICELKETIEVLTPPFAVHGNTIT